MEDKLTKSTSTSSSHLIKDVPDVMNIEILIFVERMLSTFKQLMHKLELSASLPIILVHPSLSHILKQAGIIEIIQPFLDAASTHSNPESMRCEDVLNSIQVSEDNPSDCNNFQFIDENINKALEVLNRYPETRKLVKLEKRGISDPCKLFLRQIEFFIQHVITRISKTPEQERDKELYYRKIWQANKKAHLDIKNLSALLNEQNSHYHKIIYRVIHQYSKKWNMIEKLNKNYENDIKNTILKSERDQLKAHNISMDNINKLKQALNEAETNFENLCMKNIQVEKEMGARRYKAEAQLAAVISKYDSEMGEKQEELDEIMVEYNSNVAERINLEMEIEKQLEIYNALIKEKEEAILIIFREKLEKFMRLRSAKIIQRWWRKIYWRWKIKPKKGKSEKKKKMKKTVKGSK